MFSSTKNSRTLKGRRGKGGGYISLPSLFPKSNAITDAGTNYGQILLFADTTKSTVKCRMPAKKLNTQDQQRADFEQSYTNISL